MHSMYMNNPQTSQILMQAQMAPPTSSDQKPSLTKEKTKEMFFYSEEKKVDSMKKLMTSQGGMR